MLNLRLSLASLDKICWSTILFCSFIFLQNYINVSIYSQNENKITLFVLFQPELSAFELLVRNPKGRVFIKGFSWKNGKIRFIRDLGKY